MASVESQIDAAQRMYNARAETYDDSWHPGYSRRFIELVPLKPGDRVLSLCCGTGLDVFLAAEKVGDNGEVVGVDISEGMLKVAREKRDQDSILGPRIKLLRHDVTSLEGLPELTKESFDVIICSNAYVLFDDPVKAARAWKEYLKPGGAVAIDITHEHNMRSALVMETVARKLGVTYVSNRGWIRSKESFKAILEQEGYVVEKIVELDKTPGKRESYFGIDEADGQFDYVVKSDLSKKVMTPEFVQQARGPFKEEFASQAVDGKFAIVDAMYLYIARK